MNDTKTTGTTASIQRIFTGMMELIFHLIILGIIVFFLYVGIYKLWTHKQFFEGLIQTPMIPKGWYVGAIVYGIPITCLISAIMSLLSFWFKKLRTWGIISAGLLLAVFTGFTIAILEFADYIPCFCLGIHSEMSWEKQLELNVIMFFLVGVANMLDTLME